MFANCARTACFELVDEAIVDSNLEHFWHLNVCMIVFRKMLTCFCKTYAPNYPT